MANLLKAKQVGRLKWYSNELLVMASELADRLLPAFNTTSGVPHSRVFFISIISCNLSFTNVVILNDHFVKFKILIVVNNILFFLSFYLF